MRPPPIIAARLAQQRAEALDRINAESEDAAAKRRTRELQAETQRRVDEYMRRRHEALQIEIKEAA